MSVLRYAARAADCNVLGPGNRAALWVHGCCFNCAGCIAEAYKTGPFQEASPEELAAWYLAQNAAGLTISGGEPMLQAKALSEMMDSIRQKQDCGLIVYTGFLYEDLLAREDPAVGRFLGQIDLLIDGPYRRELDWNQPARGSENQRLLSLTDRYREELASYYLHRRGRQVELRLSAEQTLLIGVPGREQREIWENLKRLGETYEA